MEKYILENPDSFNLEHIFECGQCFRWNKVEENTYIGVIKDAVIKVQKEKNRYIFTGKSDNGNFEDIINYYFDLATNYSIYKEKLSKIDKFMDESVKFGEGIRILRQDLWETIISFIISANNNIPRIKKIIERLSKEYGKEVEFEGKKYYKFPTPEELADVSAEELRKLGLGFRDERIVSTTHMVLMNQVNLDELKKMNNTEIMREELLKLDGVGPKVADCILLFALKRFDVFPVDVWVRRVMNDLYIHNEVEEKVSKRQLQELAEDKFGRMSGLAQQYLFYWKREDSKGA